MTFAAPGVVGRPLLRSLGAGWLLAWQDGRRSWMAPLSRDGRAGGVLDMGEGVPPTSW